MSLLHPEIIIRVRVRVRGRGGVRVWVTGGLLPDLTLIGIVRGGIGHASGQEGYFLT